MKMSTAFLAVVASMLMVSFAYAGSPPHAVDVRDFDIAGVKLGMDWDQAVAAVAQHFQVAPSEIKSGVPSIDIPTITGSTLPDLFYYEKDGVKLVVGFVVRVPVDKVHPLMVYNVRYELPLTKENKAAMKEAALAKYGEPSDKGMVFQKWCPKPQKNGDCEDKDQAVLRLGSNELTLSDHTLWEMQIKFFNDLKSRKPSF